MFLKRWLETLSPSYASLRESNRAAARHLTRAQARERIEGNAILRHPAAEAQRQEILALTAGPFPEAAHTRCLELLREALQAQNYPVRPGTVEDVWVLEGLFDRLLES